MSGSNSELESQINIASYFLNIVKKFLSIVITGDFNLKNQFL